MNNNENDYSLARDVINKVIEQILPDKNQEYTQLFRTWNEIAGMDLATHVRPMSIVRHSLILQSDHPGWSQKFMLEKNNILKNIQKNYPELEINKITIHVNG